MTNIALVVLDTLRKDAFDEHFEWLPGRRFENAWAPSHWTTPVHASLFTGKYASEIGVVAGSQSLDCERSVLAEHLAEAGYRTRGVSCNINVSEAYDFNRGFDELEAINFRPPHRNPNNDLYDWSTFSSVLEPDDSTWKRYTKALKVCVTEDCATIPSLLYGLKYMTSFGDSIEPERPDMGAQEVLQRVSEMSFGDREFLFLNLMEAHGPYDIPAEYQTVSSFEAPDHPRGKVTSDIELGPLSTRYDNSAKYLSETYRKIFAELKSEFDYVLTVSDHGELLGEHGFYGHSYGIFPELCHVPFCISNGSGESEHVETGVTLLDVHATILDLAGIDADSRGENVLEESSEREFLTEYHGVAHPSRRLSQMIEFGMTDTEIQTYQESRLGVFLPPDYYGYGTLNAFEERGTSPVPDPKSVMQNLIDDLDREDVDYSGTDVPQSVESNLENLGYI